MKLLADNIFDPELAFHFAYSTAIKVQPEPHSHDFFEFFLTFEDHVEHRVNGASQMLGNGSLVFIRPADEHNFGIAGAHAAHLMNVAFRKETFEAMCAYLEYPDFIQSLLVGELPPVVVLQKAEQHWVKSRFEEIALSSETNKPMLKHRFKMQLIQLFVHFFERHLSVHNPAIPSWIIELRALMQQREHFHAGLSRLIELSGKSQEHVNRSVKKYFGMTTTEWLNTFKLQYAANLLLYSEMDIIEISLDSGFDNLSHFYKMFKKQFLATPAKYRHANKKMII